VHWQIDLYSSLTLVMQETLLFNDTILGNLLLGVKDPPSDAVIKKVLQSVSLWDAIQELPLKLQMPSGINGARLSGGFRQRLSVARGILSNRPVMLLDEPTSAQARAPPLSPSHSSLLTSPIAVSSVWFKWIHQLSRVEHQSR
jgi:ABC-type multidrug transport system fused ATPase/permease subunit